MAKRNSPSQPKPSAGSVENQLSEAMSTTARLLESIASRSENPKWFPNGITKIAVTLKAGLFEFGVQIVGPPAVAEQSAAEGVMRQVVTTPDITFTITQRVGRKARGTLSWPAKNLQANAVSGDSGHDAIPLGTWTGIAFQERPGDQPYCDTSGNCWFSVFADQQGRTDMGIHPDGGTTDATLGCIGLRSANTRAWHDALLARNGEITCLIREATNVRERASDGIFETEA